jgi:succinoglycan biosynthesis protein ExoM
VRPAHRTGTRLVDCNDMRTGNVLMRRALFRDDSAPFDVALGRSGGEDTQFFRRKLAEGRRFYWCNEARVHETVPAERQRLRYHVRRALLLGGTAAARERFASRHTARSVVAVVLYSVSLPIAILTGYHRFAVLLVKDCNHLAKLLAHVGVRLVRERA